jgi:hypothetical protein
MEDLADQFGGKERWRILRDRGEEMEIFWSSGRILKEKQIILRMNNHQNLHPLICKNSGSISRLFK